jgi:hypothetical protein
MKQFRHGKSDHPDFPRWNGFIQRCYNPTYRDYHYYGARGIRADAVWSPTNPEGVINFIRWFDEAKKKFLLQHPDIGSRRIELGRLDVNKNFGPDNCVIRFVGASTRLRRIARVTEESAIAMRRYKRAHPDASLRQMETIFEVSMATISRVLTGVAWSCVDEIEPPFPKVIPRIINRYMAAAIA